MNKFFVAVCAAVIGFAMASSDAEARRLGGGSSFGMQRSIAPRAPASAPAAVPGKPAPAQQAQAPASAASQPGGASRWLGPLAGIAAGVGLAALLSHFGIGEGLGSILILAALIFGAIFLFRMLFARRQPAPQYAGAGAPARFEAVNMPAGGGTSEATMDNVPAGFDVAGFVRHAKLNFLRLQTANDAGNFADLKEFTSPEVFAELKMQIDERRGATQQTDVVQLDAELLGVDTEATRHVASVRFHGLLREEADAAPAPFAEVWHLAKPVDGSTGWVVAGIQQVQ